jgi:cytidylate kinase
MAIITIARGTLKAATDLSARLSEALGWPVVTREEVYESARTFGIEETGLGELSFIDERPPSFWHVLSDKRKRYLACFQASLMDRALPGDLVYVGHLGHLLISGFGRVLRVRLAAPPAHRVQMLVRERRMTEAEAMSFIREVDERRLRWSQFLYGVDWRDPGLYDLVLNAEKLRLETITGALVAMARSPEMQVTPSDRQRMSDLRLAAVARAILLRSSRTRGLDVTIVADAASRKLRVYCPPASSVSESVAGIFPFAPAESFDAASSWDRDLRATLGGVPGVSSIEVTCGEPPSPPDAPDWR